MSQETFTFFRSLLQEGVPPGSYILIFTITGDTRTSYWFQTIEAAVAFVATCTADNCYFGLGLSPRDFGPHKRCTGDEIAGLLCLGCDFDIYAEGIHEKPGLPRTLEEAHKIFPAQHPPSMISSSGHGLQGFWVFREPWIFTSPEDRDRAAAISQRWHNYLVSDAARLKYVIDPVHDLARVLRVPGSENRKRSDDPRMVTIIQDNGRRYDPTDLENICDILGIPEKEVRRVDENGTAEYGDLVVNPRVEMDPETQQKIDAYLVNDNDFKAVWHRRKPLKDRSWTGYALSIADRLALAEFSDQQIVDVLTVHRRQYGDVGKRGPKTLRWFVKYAITPAHAWAQEQKEKNKKREDRESRKKEAAGQEAQEQADITAVRASKDAARANLRTWLELPVHRLIQVGQDADPSYKLVLKDEKDEVERVIEIPSLAVVNSFVGMDRCAWRYTRTPLPSKARKKWRQIRVALGELVEIEDTGVGVTELMLCDVAEYFCGAVARSLWDNFPLEKYPEGPPRNDVSWYHGGWSHGIVHAIGEQEYRIALSLLAEPRRSNYSIAGLYYTKAARSDSGRVFFSGPGFYDWLRKCKERKFEITEMNKRLVGCRFRYKDTALECGHRLRRLWTGELDDAAIDEHNYDRLGEASSRGWDIEVKKIAEEAAKERAAQATVQ